MAFDPDDFIAGKKQKIDTGTASVAAGPGAFDPDAFLAGKAQPGSPEPAMVADVSAGVTEPGQPPTSAPEADAILFQSPVVNPAGPGLGSQLGSTALGQQAQNIASNARKIAQPYISTAGKVASAYAANPITKLAPDLVAAANMIPPPYATSQAIGATQGAYNVARNLPPVSATAPVNPMAQTEFGQEIARRAAAEQAETMANRSMIQKIAMSKVMQLAAPALNTAARVAGPAGLAYNAYEAANFAQDAQLGNRLAAGQGAAAQRAFRQANVPYGAGFNNNITAQQAQSILASQSARDIEAFGGTEFLRKRALGQ
jgi:hypothetical protein